MSSFNPIEKLWNTAQELYPGVQQLGNPGALTDETAVSQQMTLEAATLDALAAELMKESGVESPDLQQAVKLGMMIVSWSVHEQQVE